MFPTPCERSREARPPRPVRVLVVDDERLMRWSLRRQLAEAGHESLEAADGQSALDQLATHEGLIVMLLDYRLPDIDGFEVLRRVRSERPSCRVIIVTAHSGPEHEAEARALGAFGYVAKPFDARWILQLVERALAGKH